MPAQTRIEKHRGFTLVVRDGWLSVILDRTGHELSGPVESDEDVKRIAAVAIPALRQIGDE